MTLAAFPTFPSLMVLVAISPGPATLMSAIFLGAIFLGAIVLNAVPPETPIWQYAPLLAVMFCDETGWNSLVTRMVSLKPTRIAHIRLNSIIDRIFASRPGLPGLKLALF